MSPLPPSVPPAGPGPFTPARGLRDPHLQTIVAERIPRRFPRGAAILQPWRAAAREVVFELPDGDRLVARLHLQPEDPDRRRPVVLHLHGLEGSAESQYQVGLSAKAFAAGYHSVRLNFRLCGGSEHLAAQLYHGRRTEDVAHVVRTLRDSWGFRQVHVTGVSLGGGILLRWLADLAGKPPEGLGACVAISAPIDFRMAGQAFRQGFNRVYDRYFLRQLVSRVRRMAVRSPGAATVRPLLAQLGKLRTLQDFDTLVTGPLGGFGTPEAYYAAASSVGELSRIAVPTLLIAAQDDPFIPFAMYAGEAEAIAANPHLTPVFPRHGGHAAFLAAGGGWPEPWMDERWAENAAVAYLGAARPVVAGPA